MVYWNRRYIRNNEDLENMVYAIKQGEQMKADSPYATTVSELNNTVYGLYIWEMLNYDIVPTNVIPSAVYRKSGFRTKIARAVINTVNGNDKYGGMSELGKFPELTRGTYADISVDPKIMGMAYGETLKQELLAQTEDDTWGGLNNIKMDIADDYKEKFAERIMEDRETIAGGASADFDYNSEKSITTLDQTTSSDAEEDALGGTENGHWDAYGQYDRDSSTTYDSTVITCNTSKTIGGDNGVLDKTHFTELEEKIREKSGKNPSFYLMPYNVASEVHHLYAADNVYTTDATITTGAEGLNSTGYGVQIQTAAINNIPIVTTRYSTKRAADTEQLGHIYALQTSGVGAEGYYCELSTLLPTTDTATMWGMIHQDTISRAGFITILEYINRFPQACGKIRDIKKR